MHKILFSFFSIITYQFIILVLSFNSSVIAAEKGHAEVYKVTMTRVELCTDGTCSTPTTLCNTSKTVDIASVNAGADIGSWCSMGGLPFGTTFSHVRVHVNRTFTIKGYIEDRVGTKDCFTQDNSTGSYTRLAPGGLSDDADTIAARVEQVIPLVNANGSDAINNQAGTVTYEFTNSSTDRPIGSTAWCFGNSSTAAPNSALCTDDNSDSSSDTWDNNSSADTMQIIYPFTTPYKVGLIAPKLTIAFSTDWALFADQSSATTCELRPGSPTVTMTLTD
tara:strand:- start:68 stop:901 length:834 start_codon:yes stop_codon:yes gene_type:complete